MSKLSLEECTCSVCMSIFIEPVTMPCGHELCLPCFRENVEQTSLVCPLCRTRIASWARRCARNNMLVNQQRWAEIRQAWPDKVQKRLDGEDDSSLGLDEEDPIPAAIYSLAKPGEIREEYEHELQKLEAERAEKWKDEENASRELIEKLQREENQRMEQLAQQQIEQQEEDARLADELNKELNKEGLKSPQLSNHLNKQLKAKTPTFMERFLKKSTKSCTRTDKEGGAGDACSFPTQFLSPQREGQDGTPGVLTLTPKVLGGTPQASSSVKDALGGREYAGSSASVGETSVVHFEKNGNGAGYQDNKTSRKEGAPSLYFDKNDADNDRDSDSDSDGCQIVDVCESAIKLDENVMFAGDVSQDSVTRDLERSSYTSHSHTSVSSIGAPDWSFCEIEKPDSDMFIPTDSRTSSAKYLGKTAEIDPLDLLKEISQPVISSDVDVLAVPSTSSSVELTAPVLEPTNPEKSSPFSPPNIASLNEASNDSISIEMVHFRPIRKCPRTPPRRFAGGKAKNPPLVLTIPRNPKHEAESKGWDDNGALAEASSPIMQRRLLELSAERQAQVAAHSKSTSTETREKSPHLGKFQKSKASRAKMKLKLTEPDHPEPSNSSTSPFRRVVKEEKKMPVLPMLADLGDEDSNDYQTPQLEKSEGQPEPARSGSTPNKLVRSSSGPFEAVKVSPGKVYLMRTSARQNEKASENPANSASPQKKSLKKPSEHAEGKVVDIPKYGHLEGTIQKVATREESSQTAQKKKHKMQRQHEPSTEAPAKKICENRQQVSASEHSLNDNDNNSEVKSSLGNSSKANEATKETERKHSSARERLSKFAYIHNQDCDETLFETLSPGKRKRSVDGPCEDSGVERPDSRASAASCRIYRSKLLKAKRKTSQENHSSERLKSQAPQEKKASREMHEDSGRSREGKRNMSAIATRRSPRKLGSSDSHGVDKPHSSRRRRVEYSPTDDGKRLSRPKNAQKTKRTKQIEYSPTDTGKKISRKTARQTTLQFVPQEENSDDDYDDTGLQHHRSKLVLSRSSDSDKDNQKTLVRSRHAKTSRTTSKGKSSHRAPKSVSSATCSATSDSEMDEVFPSAALRSESSTTPQSEDQYAQKERSEFETDEAYKAYIEEQDFLLAQRLQEDFNTEAKYHLTCIRRKGTAGEYSLRKKTRGSVDDEFQAGPSGLQNSRRVSHKQTNTKR